MRRFIVVGAVVATAWLSTTSLVHAQEATEDAAARLSRIEDRIMMIERKLHSGGGKAAEGANTGMMADHEARLQSIEQESSKVYGEMEKVAHAIEELAKKVDLISKDMDLRLQDLEKNRAATPAPTADAPKAPDAAAEKPADAKANAKADEKAAPKADEKAAPKDAKPDSKEKPKADAKDKKAEIPADMKADDLYNQAYDYMSKSAFGTAEVWFKEFVARFPDHRRADNAYYWLGETYLVQNKPEDAVIAFSTGLKAFPKGEKAPDNLLKMGVAFERIGKPDMAKSAWEKLIRDFPKHASADRAKKRLESIKTN